MWIPYKKLEIALKVHQVRPEKPLYPGYFYVPEAPGPHPGILLLHGSEGGYGDFWTMPGEPPLPTGESKYVVKLAKHLASLGYATYAYAYFQANSIPGFQSYPPSELVNVDMRDTAAALEWLKSSPFVDGSPVGIWGASRGAEHALIFTSSLKQLKDFKAAPDLVIAHSPSDFVYPGFSKEAADALSRGEPFPEDYTSAWSIGGSPLEMFSPIEIENTNVPMLITYGTNDEIWGPYVDVQKMENRLTSSGRDVLHLDFSNNDDPMSALDLISKEISDRSRAIPSVFLRFLDEGHNPRLGTSSAKLQSLITELFLKKYLCS